jgi:outer membrane protein assembly factor BamB
MNLRRLAFCLILPAALAGCSGFLQSVSGDKPKGPSHLEEFKPTAEFSVRWHVELGQSDFLQPAVSGKSVYAANTQGELFRLDRATGREIWRVQTGLKISGGVGLGDGFVLTGSEKGELAAFDESGKLRWKVKASSEILSAPTTANGIVVVRTGDGRITGLSATDGTRQWQYERATPSLIVRSHAGVRISHGVVYAGFAGGKLVALNAATGVTQWEATVSVPRGNTELERISDVTSLPVSDLDQVCAASFQGNVACFDTAQGNPIWSRELSSDKGIALSGKYLYATDANGDVHALDKTSGSSLWKNDQLNLRRTSAPLVIDPYIAVGDYEGYVHLLSREDGRIAARFKTEGGSIDTAPVELDDGLLVQTAKGGLYSLAIH